MKPVLFAAVLLTALAVCAAATPAWAVEADPHDAHGVAGHDDAGHAAHGNTNPLSVDPDLAIFTAIVFLCLLLVLTKFAWRPIMHGLEAREKHVADEIAAAELRHREAQEMLAKHEALIAGAADQTRQMLEDARKQAEATSQKIVGEAQDAVKRDRDRLLAEIEAAKNQALHELASKTADTAVSLAGRIVRRELRPDEHAQLISQTLERFPNNSRT